MTVTQQWWEILHKLGLANYVFTEKRNENIVKSSLGIFNTKRWIPAVVPGKAPIYPYESETFYVFQFKQDCQLLTEAGGCCKYCSKYLSETNKKITSKSQLIMKRKDHMHQI